MQFIRLHLLPLVLRGQILDTNNHDGSADVRSPSNAPTLCCNQWGRNPLKHKEFCGCHANSGFGVLLVVQLNHHKNYIQVCLLVITCLRCKWLAIFETTQWKFGSKTSKISISVIFSEFTFQNPSSCRALETSVRISCTSRRSHRTRFPGPKIQNQNPEKRRK